MKSNSKKKRRQMNIYIILGVWRLFFFFNTEGNTRKFESFDNNDNIFFCLLKIYTN